MEDHRLGTALRAVRVRRRWRQVDVAIAAGISTTTVSRAERGDVGPLTIATLRKLAAGLGIRIDLIARWRGGDLDRLLSWRHSALHETVARELAVWAGWTFAPEVSFSIYGERGVIDILGWHAERKAVLVIELKTEIVDVQDLVASLDRKRRLADRVAAGRGWRADHASCWVIVEEGRSNRSRVEAHRAMLRAAFPADGREMRRWLRQPASPVSALSFLHNYHLEQVRHGPVPRRRVRMSKTVPRHAAARAPGAQSRTGAAT